MWDPCIWPCGVNYLPIVLNCFSNTNLVCRRHRHRRHCRCHSLRYAHFNIEMKLSPRRLMPKILLSVLHLRFYDVFFIRTIARGFLFKNELKHSRSRSLLTPISYFTCASFDSISLHIDLARKLVHKKALCRSKFLDRTKKKNTKKQQTRFITRITGTRKGYVARMKSHVIHKHTHLKTHTKYMPFINV